MHKPLGDPLYVRLGTLDNLMVSGDGVSASGYRDTYDTENVSLDTS